MGLYNIGDWVIPVKAWNGGYAVQLTSKPGNYWITSCKVGGVFQHITMDSIDRIENNLEKAARLYPKGTRYMGINEDGTPAYECRSDYPPKEGYLGSIEVGIRYIYSGSADVWAEILAEDGTKIDPDLIPVAGEYYIARCESTTEYIIQFKETKPDYYEATRFTVLGTSQTLSGGGFHHIIRKATQKEINQYFPDEVEKEALLDKAKRLFPKGSLFNNHNLYSNVMPDEKLLCNGDWRHCVSDEGKQEIMISTNARCHYTIWQEGIWAIPFQQEFKQEDFIHSFKPQQNVRKGNRVERKVCSSPVSIRQGEGCEQNSVQSRKSKAKLAIRSSLNEGGSVRCKS